MAAPPATHWLAPVANAPLSLVVVAAPVEAAEEEPEALPVAEAVEAPPVAEPVAEAVEVMVMGTLLSWAVVTPLEEEVWVSML